MSDIAFLIPGDLNLPTGGYGYDRAVIRLLPGQGVQAMHVALPGSFPMASDEDLADCAAIVQGLPPGCPLLIDGLAYGAMPAGLIRSFNRPIIALCHHPLALENGISAARAQALHASEATALSLADHVIVTSPLTAKILEGDFGVPAGKITVAIPGTARKPRATGSGEAVLNLLAVGSIVPRKGYAVLVEALAGLKKRAWHLRIVGAAHALDTVNALQQQISQAGLADRIQLLGAVRERDLDMLYEKADLFVMSSLFEGYGMVLGEAMQRGLPIVTTTGGAASDTVPEGAGLKVPPGDAGALQGALEQAMADPALRARLADEAYRAGQSLPDWADTARIIAGALAPFLTSRKVSA
ncbi:MAG: glycosyltransferase family 4 protein [Beijerinckiaceae bacterium]|nr:glycosyltransferase family 4 protein [Beijerinckiaceae bacterium]